MNSNYFLLLITFLIMSCKGSTQSTLKKSKVEETPNIYFSKVDITKHKVTSGNYSSTFKMNKDEFLNIHFTLKNTLIENLQLLAPNLTQDQLVNKGNFQFTFLIDGEIVYVENLNTGAGTIHTKTTKLDYSIPLVYPKKIDFWGWFVWLRFMKLGGGQDILVKNSHSLKIEIRTYIKSEKLKVGPIIAEGSTDVAVMKIPVDENLIPVQKIQPNSGWELSKDRFDNSKIEALNRKIAEKRFKNINGIVVAKENKLLIE